MNTTRLCLLVFLFQCIGGVAQPDSLQQVESADTIRVEVRHFNENKIEELKSDPDLSYEQGKAALGLWERLKLWLLQFFGRAIQAAVTTDWMRVFVYLLAGAALVYVILRLLKIDALKMLYSGSDKGSMKPAALEEDIHAMNFEQLIQDAISRKEYRVAIRLIFLNALKLLSDNHHIHWMPGKTNHDYMNELVSSELKGGFGQLNFYFEYAWYGNFSIHEETLTRVRDIFSNWKNKVNG